MALVRQLKTAGFRLNSRYKYIVDRPPRCQWWCPYDQYSFEAEKKQHFRQFFWTPDDTNFETGTFKTWTQFPSQKKISQSTILFFQRFAGIFSQFKPFSGDSKDIQQWAAKNVQTHFGNAPLSWFTEKFLCAFSRFVCPKNEDVWGKVQTYFGSSPLARFEENVLGAFSRFIWSKTKLFAMKFRRILEVLRLQGSQKKFWAHFHDFCVQKRRCLGWSSGAFWKFSACTVYRKSSGRIFMICASKNESACCEVQMHLEVFVLQDLQKLFWMHFYDLCVNKRSCLLWSSDAFWRFYTWKVYIQRVLSTFSRNLRPETKLFAVEFRCSLEVFALQGL